MSGKRGSAVSRARQTLHIMQPWSSAASRSASPPAGLSGKRKSNRTLCLIVEPAILSLRNQRDQKPAHGTFDENPASRKEAALPGLRPTTVESTAGFSVPRPCSSREWIDPSLGAEEEKASLVGLHWQAAREESEALGRARVITNIRRNGSP